MFLPRRGSYNRSFGSRTKFRDLDFLHPNWSPKWPMLLAIKAISNHWWSFRAVVTIEDLRFLLQFHWSRAHKSYSRPISPRTFGFSHPSWSPKWPVLLAIKAISNHWWPLRAIVTMEDLRFLLPFHRSRAHKSYSRPISSRTSDFLHQIHGSDPWIRSMDQIHGSDPWIRSMDQIHGSDPWIRSVDQIHGSDPWIPRGPKWVPKGSQIQSQIHGSDPWIWSMDLIHESDPWIWSMDQIVQLTFWRHFETFRSSRLFSRLRG